MSLFRFFGTAGRIFRQTPATAPPSPGPRRSPPLPPPGMSEAERRETEIPASTDPATRWAESGEWFDGFSSSNVQAIQYHSDDQRLLIQYLDGSMYAYHPVSMGLAMSLYGASSKGTWVWDNLRVRGTVFGYQIPYELLSGPSQRTLGKEARHWMRTQESRRKHGEILPSGRDASGRTIRPRDLR